MRVIMSQERMKSDANIQLLDAPFWKKLQAYESLETKLSS